jgi:hypothetical protein
MNDPQNDIACTACETEGPRSRLDDGLCPDCRTPAGRLVTALAARGVKATKDADDFELTVDGMDIGADPIGWSIISVADVPDEEAEHFGAEEYAANIEAAADAIAAIVQAPGLRDERDTLAARVRQIAAAIGTPADVDPLAGFAAKAAIHPAQLPAIHQAFQPTVEPPSAPPNNSTAGAQ